MTPDLSYVKGGRKRKKKREDNRPGETKKKKKNRETPTVRTSHKVNDTVSVPKHIP